MISPYLVCASYDMSVFDVDDPVGHPGDLRIVGDHDDGLVKFPAGHFQKSDHVVAGPGVQVSGGLVGKDDGGLAGEGSRNCHTLLLAAESWFGRLSSFFSRPRSWTIFMMNFRSGLRPSREMGRMMFSQTLKTGTRL